MLSSLLHPASNENIEAAQISNAVPRVSHSLFIIYSPPQTGLRYFAEIFAAYSATIIHIVI